MGCTTLKKTEKIRVVFDCSAEYQGKSLNQQLFQGPDLTNNLIGVLIRFRKYEVAYMTDVESMFHQVKCPENDRDLLRFFMVAHYVFYGGPTEI